VRLVGYLEKKSITMHGNMNGKFKTNYAVKKCGQR